jgi:hypothetical protein
VLVAVDVIHAQGVRVVVKGVLHLPLPRFLNICHATQSWNLLKGAGRTKCMHIASSQDVIMLFVIRSMS